MPTRWRTVCLLLIAATVGALISAAQPAAAVNDSAAQGCENLVNNGGFEVDFGWEFDPSPVPPQYVNSVVRSDNRSLQLGIAGGANLNASSAARQRVAIPADAGSAILSFWYYPIVEASPGADYFEFAVYSADGANLLAGPWRMPVGFEWWNQALFDFSAWRGQSFQLYFNVYNDGAGGRTVVFLDDVSLATCPTPVSTFTPSPTPWPTPVWTPWPTPGSTSWPTPPPAAGCFDVLQNGSFDAGLAGWTPGNNALGPSPVSEPVLTPPNAVELGSTVQNVNSYSSIRQTAAIPAGWRTFIGFWEYTWAESLEGNDRQQFVILGPGNVVWATPWKVLESSGAWQQHLYELLGAPSPLFDVYFAAVNDGVGGRTALYVDEVHVWACSPGAVPVTTLPEMTAPSTFAEPAFSAEVVPLTPDPSQFAAPAPDPSQFGAAPQPPELAPVAGTASPTPVVVPFGAAGGQDGRGIVEATPLPAGTPADLSNLPTPGWTEVAISGQPTAAAAAQPALTGAPFPSDTPPPPEARAIGTPELNPQAVLTQVVAAAETVAPSSTRLPFGLLTGIQERTAQWPIPWYWVLLIIVVVVALLIWVLRRASRGNYYNP